MSSHNPSERHLETIRDPLQARLLEWYRSAQRVLPWRNSRDPYAIWVSEIMLQQTQVSTVIPYFHRFMQSYPTMEALANAPQEDVLSHWRGLGYYARARNLHRGARTVMDRFGGRLPDDPGQLLKVPGIGRYTCGAISSIAFGRKVAVLDGNVGRVLCRIFGLRLDIKSTAGQKILWKWAEALVPETEPGEFNQAMMELGACVCTPSDPSCATCPLKELCHAAGLPDPTVLPLRPPTRNRPEANAVCLVISPPDDDRILFGLRPEKGLLGGMWELPTLLLKEGESLQEGTRRLGKERLGTTETPWKGQPVRVEHVFTHLKLILFAVVCARPLEALPEAHLPEVARHPWREANVLREDSSLKNAQPRLRGVEAVEVPYQAFRWVGAEERARLPMGKATIKALEALAITSGPRP